MKLRWSRRASDDLERIEQYIGRDNPVAAKRVATAIKETAARLEAHPYLGYSRSTGARHLGVARYPYVIRYRIRGEFIHIGSIWHDRQKRPS